MASASCGVSPGSYWLGEGLGEGDLAGLAVCTPLARALLVVVMLGVATGPGPWLAK